VLPASYAVREPAAFTFQRFFVPFSGPFVGQYLSLFSFPLGGYDAPVAEGHGTEFTTDSGR
jgi:hypothetical protein